ncbi:MAG: glycosyltransferase [Marivita lacus]|nr:glycosyltransferase [Marivita lacus]
MPVLTTRIAGVPELVEDRVSGRVVAPGDVGAFADALDRLLSDAELRKAYGAAGRAKVVAEYDAAREARWLSELITTYTEGRATPGLRPEAEAAS